MGPQKQRLHHCSWRSLDTAHLPDSCTAAMCHTLQDINKTFIWLLKVALYRHVLLTVQFTFYPPLIHLMSELIGINGGQIAVKFARAEPCKLLIWSGISPWPPQAKRPAKILRHEMIRESMRVYCVKSKRKCSKIWINSTAKTIHEKVWYCE